MTEESKNEESRIGVAAIIVEDAESVHEVNETLHRFSRLIVGRLGIPYRERGLSVISVVLDGATDEISALTGKLGKIKSVTVKAAMSKK
ncbi:MAG: iron-only hydrogenase system regulator [Synergistaceae bacterium]|nr:iron-only hydrogenase system regulator [Synergistaceae bacterium]